MTHFSVLVIGDNIEQQLATYDENLPVAPYKAHLDSRSIERMRAWLHAEKSLGASPEQVPDEAILAHMAEWTGCTEGLAPGKDEGGFYTWSTYNPQHRWDFYQVGGRWRGSLTLRKGALGALGSPGVPEAMAMDRGELDEDHLQRYRGKADLARKGDVDFVTAERTSRRHAAKTYDLMAQVTAGIKPPRRNFAERLQRRAGRRGLGRPYPREFVDKVRQDYNRHPWIKAIAAHDRDEWEKASKDPAYEPRTIQGFMAGDPVDAFEVHTGGRKAFLESCAAAGAYPFAAVLHNGQWMSPMAYYGPFAALQDAGREEAIFTRKVKALIESLPDDTLLTVVDCHT